MRAPSTGTFLTLAVLVTFGCSSSSDGGAPTPVTDSGKLDTNVVDSTTDTAKTDSVVTTDGDSGGGKDCDPHPGDECSMLKQNCPTGTDTCEYDATAGHNVCGAKSPGTATKGEACDATTNPCDKGLFCYNKKCSPACCPGDNSPCGTTGTCSLAITDTSSTIIYHVCSYDDTCKPFMYNCAKGSDCYFDSAPDVFKCHTPTGTTGDPKPGTACKFVNDCGESQTCTTISTSGTDAGTATSKCYLFCWMTKPSGWVPGTTPDGRFAADGTCTIGGTSYGTCKSVTGIGGGLGLCLP